MDAMAEVAIWAVATALAAGTAWAMAWAFLQGAFRLIEPAATPRIQVRTTRVGHQPKS